MYQKAQRMTDIPKGLANLSHNADVQQAYRAGLVAKSDLIYEMVFGFTDPQGVIGRYYAKALGESEVANAIEQQYWPKYSGALLPKTDVAVSVALAEKLDTFVGMFGIG